MVIKGIEMVFFKILLWLVIPFGYFMLLAIYFMEFKKVDLAAFNSLKNINTQIFYYSAIGGLIFAYTCKPIIKKLKQKEMAYADGVVDYLIMIMVFFIYDSGYFCDLARYFFNVKRLKLLTWNFEINSFIQSIKLKASVACAP